MSKQHEIWEKYGREHIQLVKKEKLLYEVKPALISRLLCIKIMEMSI